MQLTLLDIITDITGDYFCEICSQPCGDNEICSRECAETWVKIYIDDVWSIKKDD